MSSTGEHDHQGPPIRATIVRYDGRPDECTLHPSDPDEERRLTEWITAESDAYTTLTTCR